MKTRHRGLDFLEGVAAAHEPPKSEPKLIESPCSVCGAEGFASYPDDNGPMYCLDHYPSGKQAEMVVEEAKAQPSCSICGGPGTYICDGEPACEIHTCTKPDDKCNHPDPIKEKWAADPRPDIKADSAFWHTLLSMAWEIDGKDVHGLFGVLHGLRCCGAKLLPVPPDKVRLVQGEYNAEEWAMVRERDLVPRAEALTALLTRVRGS